MDFKLNPVIVGGIAGSGTRVFCQICKDAGIFMGTNLNKSNDAMEFFDFYNKWIDQWLGNKVKEKKIMIEEFNLCIKKHLENIPGKDTRWGFKNPRSIHLLPFFYEIFPQMNFLHVVRDGRDMCYSTHRVQQIEKQAPIIINKKIEKPEDKLHFWRKVNLEAAFFGKSKLKGNYLRIRFEDICYNPKNAIGLIYEFLGVSNLNFDSSASKIKKPNTIGRWKQHDDLTEISKLDIEALNHFGYL